MRVCYIACPIGAPTKEGVTANVERAKRWLRFLQKTFPERAFVAPYLDWIEVCGDADDKPEDRERGLRRDCAVVARCDEFWPVGCGAGGMSKGMTRELASAGRVGPSEVGLMPSQGVVVFGHYLSFVEPPEDIGKLKFTIKDSPPSPAAPHREPDQKAHDGLGAESAVDGGREGAAGATRHECPNIRGARQCPTCGSEVHGA